MLPVMELQLQLYLAQAIYAHGIKNVAAGANPMDLKRGIDKAVDAVVENLRKQSKKIKGLQRDHSGSYHLFKQ